ncbi:O-antigen ligase family protein [Bosea sp. ASV33]|uniref:O-antigen ligase family protein n=1 Tax=Bosea sp. ASV33 TaxID=2795106 RepID=UPI0018EE10B7|nr:O-antigen ligase family protein [Bosea sp. ASV33]
MFNEMAWHMRLRNVAYRGSDALFLAIVALAPLPFGLTAPLPLAIVCLGLALSLSTANFRHVAMPHLRGVWPVIATVAIYLSVAALQHVAGGVRLLPAAPVWAEAEAAFGFPLPAHATWSLSRFWEAIGAPIVALLVLIRATILSTRRDGALKLFATVAVAGAAYAIYGVIAHLTAPELLLWRPKTAYLDAVTGPFVNRNTAATYWGSCAVICFAMAVDGMGGKGWRARRGLEVSVRAALAWSGLAVCLLALAMTGSRAGAALTLAALMIVAAMLWARESQGMRWSFRRVGLAAASLSAVVLVLGGATLARVRTYGIYDEQRAIAYGDSLAMIVAHPWLGIGVGAFADVFPRFRSADLGSSGIWDRVHSTPLEIAVEAGLPVTTLIVATCMFLVHQLLRGCFQRRRDRFFPVAALGCMWLGVAHSCIDFSLQIPGYAVVFAAIIGLGLAQSVSTRLTGNGVAGEH